MINIRKYGFAGLLGVVLTGSVARAISPDSLKDRLSEQDLSVDALRGAFGVTRLLAGESVHLGQAMKVRIAAVNVPARHLFLAPAEPLVTERPQLNRRKYKRKHHIRKKRRR